MRVRGRVGGAQIQEVGGGGADLEALVTQVEKVKCQEEVDGEAIPG